MKNRSGLLKFLIGIGMVLVLIMLAPINENLFYIALFVVLIGFLGYRIIVGRRE